MFDKKKLNKINFIQTINLIALILWAFQINNQRSGLSTLSKLWFYGLYNQKLYNQFYDSNIDIDNLSVRITTDNIYWLFGNDLTHLEFKKTRKNLYKLRNIGRLMIATRNEDDLKTKNWSILYNIDVKCNLI